mgnify:CR=1 FL=1
MSVALVDYSDQMAPRISTFYDIFVPFVIRWCLPYGLWAKDSKKGPSIYEKKYCGGHAKVVFV